MTKLARIAAQDRAPPRAPAPARRIRKRKLKYHAFLSYSHKDEELASWLHQQLESFRVPPGLVGRLSENGTIPKRLTPVFRDEHELAAADDLSDEIEAALASTQFLIVLCSPNAARSHWTDAEIRTFKKSRPDGCIFAAIAAGEPFASDVAGRQNEECFPPALRQKFDRRGRPTGKRAEPLAADLRGDAEERRLGFLKLVAGMLGVGLDDLVQRETTQRQRRMAWLAAASIAGMAVTSGLAVTAIQARNAARDERREAEGLVAFMLGDLRPKLEPIGKLDALDGVGSKVLSYYRKQDASELSDSALLQRSSALNLMADVAHSRDNLVEADALYRQALAGTAEAVRRSPNDPKRLYEHAQNIFWIGEIARARGQTDHAIAAYTQYKALADRLVALEPDNLRWRMEALYGTENAGIALYYQRRYAEAAARLREALGPMERLAAIDPSNLSYREESSTVLAWLADAERSQGHLTEAVALRQRQIAMLNQADANAKSDVIIWRELIPAHQGLGVVLAQLGQFDRAIDELKAAVAQADRLIPLEPANAIWKSYATSARLDLALTMLLLGRSAEATRETEAACAIAAAQRASETMASRWTACLQMRSRLAMRAGDSGQALTYGTQALASARQLHSDDSLKDRFRLAVIYRLIGDAAHGARKDGKAIAAWTAASRMMPAGNLQNPSEMAEQATIWRRLGRDADARMIKVRLDKIGYRRPE